MNNERIFEKKHKDFENAEHCTETFAIMKNSMISKTFPKIAKKIEFLEKNSYTRIFRIRSPTYVSFANFLTNDSGLSQRVINTN